MKKNSKVSFLFSLLMISTPVLSAPYVSAELGLTGYGNNNVWQNIFSSDAKNEKVLTGRIAGGYLWDVNSCVSLGLEAGIFGNQDFKETVYYFSDEFTYKRKGIDALAVADFSVTECFDVFAKAGAAYLKQTYAFRDMSSGVYSYSFSSTPIVPKAVLGAGYNISDNVNLNLSVGHEFYINSGFLNTAPGATSVLAGLKYTFQ